MKHEYICKKIFLASGISYANYISIDTLSSTAFLFFIFGASLGVTSHPSCRLTQQFQEKNYWIVKIAFRNDVAIVFYFWV